ncbi:MAG TPA: 1,4-alpha-glucan branching protein GlgB [Burkholderiaceae bacterium]|nr:1,4-alpha-glucan branching protein GlgB [Burkholderiaceae bacterium]
MTNDAELDALARGVHANPFAILGPHDAGDGQVDVRAFLPGAQQVALADPDGGEIAPMQRLHADGIFEARIHGRRIWAGYRLRVDYPLGHRETVDDPYRFGSILSDADLQLLREGSHLRPWLVLGAHPQHHGGVDGVGFAVWAPNAERVALVADFNHWDGRRHPMRLRHDGGVWELFVPGAAIGARYKFEIIQRGGRRVLKADPFAFAAERRPATASIVAATPPRRELPPERHHANGRSAPISIYEVHLGSWRRAADGSFLDWDALSEQLPAYVAGLGFTHVELLPISEHPFDGSWGYQPLGLFAPTSRFGHAAGFATFVAACHRSGLGVIIDWVPAHFPTDEHGLAQFDGTALYEHADPREGYHRDWNTLIYNFGRNEVRNFLVGNALYWLECWGIDGLRVDAVASMLYRDYSRNPGEWIPNAAGGRENLEAISFLKRLNEVVGSHAAGAVTVAEESTAWPGVSRPTWAGGLGFHYKWNMGWMHDTLVYLAHDPIHRRWHHGELTFSLLYAFHENFVLPFSHDEVVHGKGSMLAKMPGDRWQKFANLRACYGYMWTHPGKKLLFMGAEFAQEREWNHDRGLDWDLMTDPAHRGVRTLVRDLNALYRSRAALHELDCEPGGFEWICSDDADESALAYLRRARGGAPLLVLCNFTPVVRTGWRVGVPGTGAWHEILNTDSAYYGGSNVGNGAGRLDADEVPAHGRSHSIAVTLPPLAVVVFEMR